MVDSNVLLDVFTNDERWAEWSATHLAQAFDTGPVIVNPIIYAELSVGFARIEELEDALPAEIEREDLPWSGAFLAGRCWIRRRTSARFGWRRDAHSAGAQRMTGPAAAHPTIE